MIHAGVFLIGVGMGSAAVGFPMLERIRKLELRLRVASNMGPLWSNDVHVWARPGLYDQDLEGGL